MIYSCTIPLSMNCPLCKPKELSEKTLVSVHVKPKIKTRIADIMELSNKFEKMEIKSVRVKLNSKKKADIMSMKNLMD